MTMYLSKEPVMVTSKNDERLYVLIFKTNISYKKDSKAIGHYLQQLGSVKSWNVDHEDIDKVLRVESSNNNTHQIIKLVNEAGFFCEELD